MDVWMDVWTGTLLKKLYIVTYIQLTFNLHSTARLAPVATLPFLDQ